MANHMITIIILGKLVPGIEFMKGSLQKCTIPGAAAMFKRKMRNKFRSQLIRSEIFSFSIISYGMKLCWSIRKLWPEVCGMYFSLLPPHGHAN
jgi:hypothetical protein